MNSPHMTSARTVPDEGSHSIGHLRRSVECLVERFQEAGPRHFSREENASNQEPRYFAMRPRDIPRPFASAKSDLPLDHLQLEPGDCFRGIESLRARLGAVHDGVAAIETERVLEIVKPLAGGFIARIRDPARRLQQRGRAEEAVAVPPIAWGGGRAAGA